MRQAPEPLADLYLNLGVVLFELEEFDAAEEVLKKAARWNPITPNITFEHAEIFKKRGDMDTFYRMTTDVFPRAYTSKFVARCYRNLGYYFVEKKLWKVAAGCYLLSNHYEQNKQAQSELWYIQQEAGAEFSLPSLEEIEQYAEEYHFPLGADEDVVGIAIEFGRHAAQDGQKEIAKYFLGIAYDLTKNNIVKEWLDDLDE